MEEQPVASEAPEAQLNVEADLESDDHEEEVKEAARAEEEARKHKAQDVERSRVDQKAKLTADTEALALRLRHEKEAKQLAQANLAHKAKTAPRGIGTASVVLSPYDELQMAMGEDSGEDSPEAPAPRAKKSAMRGSSKKGVAFVEAPVEKIKKDSDYYRSEIAAAEILGKHKISEALYNEMTSPAPFVAHPAVNIALLEFVDESYTGKLAYLIR